MARKADRSSQHLRTAIESLQTELAAMDTPEQQAVRTTRFLAELADASRQVALLRQQPVGDLRDAGLSYRAIAKILGLSGNAVIQIDRERRGQPRWRPPTTED